MLFKIIIILLILLIIYIMMLTLPFVHHKGVNEHVKKAFKPEECYSGERGSERVAPILDYVDSMKMNLRIIYEAKKRIIISTYKIMSDDAAKDFMAAVMEAADRGVEVEVLVNGINDFLDLRNNEYTQAFARHVNISMYVYNRVSLLKPWKVQAALHSKYVIIDNKFYTMGGRNIFNLFMGDYGNYHNKDSEALVYETGEITGTSFQELLNYHKDTMQLSDVTPYRLSSNSEKIAEASVRLIERRGYLRKKYPEVFERYDWYKNTYETNKVTLLTTAVEAINKEPILWYKLCELSKTGKEVSIYTPYIICGKEMYSDLKDVTDNTDRVRIITNAVENGANPFGCSDYMNQKKRILNTGADIYEYSADFSSHMKAYLIDNRMTVIGSSNMDMRSVYLDTELMLAVDSEDVNTIVKEDFEHTLTYCKAVHPEGNYSYHKNYVQKELKLMKRTIYQIMRFIAVLTRRFL